MYHTAHLVFLLAFLWTAESHSPTSHPQPPSPTQDPIDRQWITLAHQTGLAQNAKFPFGAAIVDSRTNSLLCVSANQIQNGNSRWSKYSAHGEMVALENCTNLFLPDVSTTHKGNNPDWQYMTLYSNIEPCPMCAQAIIWRGVRRTVFGARASVLANTKCWGQSHLTFQEVVHGSAYFAPFEYVRGPIVDMEQAIVSGFPNYCKNNKL